MKHDNEFHLLQAIYDCTGENFDEQAEAFSEKFNTMVHECDNCVVVNPTKGIFFTVEDADAACVVPSEEGEPLQFIIGLTKTVAILFNPLETYCCIYTCAGDDGERRHLGIILRTAEEVVK